MFCLLMFNCSPLVSEFVSIKVILSSLAVCFFVLILHAIVSVRNSHIKSEELGKSKPEIKTGKLRGKGLVADDVCGAVMRKILCLHGYRQNATVFKDKTGSLRKLLKKHAEFVYISAPHLIPAAPNGAGPTGSPDDTGENTNNGKTEEQRGWYFSTPALTFNSHDKTDFSSGLEDSLEVVRKAFEDQGPFDGILGFSQGAALTSILCDLLEKGTLSYTFRFAILVSGFRSKLTPHCHFYESKKSVPTLHIIGDTDRIVEKEMCEDLTTYFESPHVMHHGGGHYVPATSKERTGYTSFLELF